MMEPIKLKSSALSATHVSEMSYGYDLNDVYSFNARFKARLALALISVWYGTRITAT